jgi:hypothetical protein
MNAHFFASHYPGLQSGGPNFSLCPWLPVVPTVCFGLAVALNLFGNVVGVMPVL